MIKYTTVITLILLVHFFKAQIILSPFLTYNYNLRQQKAELGKDTSFYLSYSNQITPEIGFSVIKKGKKKFSYGLGLSWKKYDYGYYLEFEEDFIGTIGTRHRTINIEAVGIRALANYSLTPNTKVNFILETNIPYKKKSTVENMDNYSLFRRKSYVSGELIQASNITVRERESMDMSKFYNYIVPEVNFQTQIFKNLNLHYGMKVKFWSIYNLYTINIWGYYDKDKGSNPLFSSKIDSKKMYFYFGLTYDIVFKQKSS